MADETIRALQAINATAGLTVLDVYPSNIASAMFPIAITFAGPMDASKFGCTTYITLVLLANVAQGVNPDEIFQTGTTLMKALRTAYRAVGDVNGYAIEGGGRQPSARGGFGSPFGLLKTVGFAGAEFYGFEWHCSLQEPEQ